MYSRAFRLVVLVPIALVLCGCGNPEKPKPDSKRKTTAQSKSRTPKSSRSKQKVARNTPPSRNLNSNNTVQPSSPTALTARTPQTTTPPPRPSPSRDGRYDISLSEIRDLQKDAGAVFIDARGPDLYQQSHLSGALNMPAGLHEKYIEKVHQAVQPDELVIVYCSSALCEAGNTVCDYLHNQGFTNVKVYKPGWAVLSIADVDRSSK